MNSEIINDPSVPYTRMRHRESILRKTFDGFISIFKPTILCDVGAFDGEESFRFSQLLPDSQVFAFEASPRNFKQFFVDNPRFSDINNFNIEHTAIADKVGTTILNVLDADEERTDWRRGANSIFPRLVHLESTSVAVPCTTLDHYFGDDLIRTNTFALWIDVEGALEKVLLGAGSVLEKTLFIRAEVEWKEIWTGQKLAPEMKSMMEGMGFITLGDTFLPNGYDQSDVVLVNRHLLDLIAEQTYSD